MIYLTAIGLPPGGRSTSYITNLQTIHRTTQSTQTIHRTAQFTNQEECGPCPVFAAFTREVVGLWRKIFPETTCLILTGVLTVLVNVIVIIIGSTALGGPWHPQLC